MGTPVLSRIGRYQARDRLSGLLLRPETAAASWLARVLRPLLVTGLFIGAAVFYSYPLAFRPASAIGLHGDAFFSVWRLAWVAHQLRTDPLHLFDGNIFYPETKTLAFSDAILLPAVALAPFNWLGADPLALYNITLLGAFVLNALTAYLLVRRLTGSVAGGLLGGMIFAFSPHRFDHFDHLEMQFAFWIPLAVLAWHEAVTGERVRKYLKVAALVSCQVLSCIYYSIFLLTWLAVFTAFWFVRTPGRAARAGMLMMALPTLVLAIYSLPYLEARDRLGERKAGEITHLSATPGDFLSATDTNRFYGWTATLSVHERHLFPGAVAVVLLVIGLWPPMNRVRAAHLVGLALAVQLTLGFNGFIYRFLYEWVLPYRGLRVPARADVLVLLGTSVFAGFGLARLTGWIKTQSLAATVATLVIAGASLEYWSRPHLQEVDRRVSVWYEWLRTIPNAVVFEWPVTVPWRLYDMRDVTYMYRSTLHWRPLVNGYSGNYPDSYIRLLLEMRSFPFTGSVSYLRTIGANVLVVHEDPGARPSYDDVVARLVREPGVEVFAQGLDAGTRVTFFHVKDPAQ